MVDAKRCTHAVALFFVVDQGNNIFGDRFLSIVTPSIQAEKRVQFQVLRQPEKTTVAGELIIVNPSERKGKEHWIGMKLLASVRGHAVYPCVCESDR